MKIISVILSCFLSSKLHAQGIGPPAGLGDAYLILAVAMLIVLLLLFFILKYFFKRVNNKRKYLIWVSSLIIVVVFLSTVGVAFVPAELIDNNPLESHLSIVAHKDGNYLALSDGHLYRFKDKNHRYYSSVSEDKNLQKDQMVMLEAPGDTGDLMVYGVGQSSAYYHYQRVKQENLINIPLFRPAINKNQKTYEGVVVKLAADWRAEENNLVNALTRSDCCDVAWIKELLKRGANDDDVINKHLLLHRFFNHTDREYINKHRFEITELLLAAGADINAINNSGLSVLHQVVRKMPQFQKAELSDSDRQYLQLLFDQGADPNISYYDGVSLLNNTIVYRQYEILELLLHNGADIHKRVQGKKSAYEMAQYYLQQQKAVLSDNDELDLAAIVALMDAD